MDPFYSFLFNALEEAEKEYYAGPGGPAINDLTFLHIHMEGQENWKMLMKKMGLDGREDIESVHFYYSLDTISVEEEFANDFDLQLPKSKIVELLRFVHEQNMYYDVGC